MLRSGGADRSPQPANNAADSAAMICTGDGAGITI
jgi:hypothetical protein